MREIELPITQTFSLTIDLHRLAEDQGEEVDGVRRIPLGNIVDGEKMKITELARKNGGKILYATTSIERQMESLLLSYFMGPFAGHSQKRAMFENEILQSSVLTFHAKKELVKKVIDEGNLLPGASKNQAHKYMKQVMEWRNAFAHGKIQYDSMKGCLINYYSGSKKILLLNDEYWENVENTFKECSELLKNAYENMH